MFTSGQTHASLDTARTVRFTEICANLTIMNAVLDPIISEFDSEDQALSYDRWFRAKVEQSLAKADDPNQPRYTTDEVMHRMDKIIKATEAKHAARRLA
jgi:hypothetical protein